MAPRELASRPTELFRHTLEEDAEGTGHERNARKANHTDPRGNYPAVIEGSAFGD